jgi:hypothetical protein
MENLVTYAPPGCTLASQKLIWRIIDNFDTEWAIVELVENPKTTAVYERRYLYPVKQFNPPVSANNGAHEFFNPS